MWVVFGEERDQVPALGCCLGIGITGQRETRIHMPLCLGVASIEPQEQGKTPVEIGRWTVRGDGPLW